MLNHQQLCVHPNSQFCRVLTKFKAIHSIEYGVPVPSFFMFSVYDATHGGFWWFVTLVTCLSGMLLGKKDERCLFRPWDSVVALATLLQFPTASVIHRGKFSNAGEIKRLMDSGMKIPSSVQRSHPQFASLAHDQHVRSQLYWRLDECALWGSNIFAKCHGSVT